MPATCSQLVPIPVWPAQGVPSGATPEAPHGRPTLIDRLESVTRHERKVLSSEFHLQRCRYRRSDAKRPSDSKSSIARRDEEARNQVRPSPVISQVRLRRGASDASATVARLDCAWPVTTASAGTSDTRSKNRKSLSIEWTLFQVDTSVCSGPAVAGPNAGSLVNTWVRC